MGDLGRANGTWESVGSGVERRHKAKESWHLGGAMAVRQDPSGGQGGTARAAVSEGADTEEKGGTKWGKSSECFFYGPTVSESTWGQKF